ncbi:non-canonical purine NTP pyrophosphatase [Candidatus Microgenomates bacterium]|nr:non-canonical purine NTP pyrophosphatase [Candidatus Microgenomates bacterium]
MKKLLIATRNSGKLLEISNFLSSLPIKTVSLADLGIKDNVEETGKTYQENSVKKARFYAKLSGLPTIADDGGVEIDALGGAPGVKSRRFFGKNGKEATDEEIMIAMKKLVAKFSPDKQDATFKVVITLALPNRETFSVEGEIKGILRDPRVKLLSGYPYRSFFYLPKIKKYYHESELSEEEQKLYNHRYKAIKKLKPIIKKILGFR